MDLKWFQFEMTFVILRPPMLHIIVYSSDFNMLISQIVIINPVTHPSDHLGMNVSHAHLFENIIVHADKTMIIKHKTELHVLHKGQLMGAPSLNDLAVGRTLNTNNQPTKSTLLVVVLEYVWFEL